MFEIVAVMGAYQEAQLEAESRRDSHRQAMEQGPEALAAWDRAEEKRKRERDEACALRLREREVSALEELARQGRRTGSNVFGAALAGSILGNLLVD